MDNMIIDRETYRAIKKMSREELQAFLMRYAEGLSKDPSTVDLQELEKEGNQGYRGETSQGGHESD